MSTPVEPGDRLDDDRGDRLRAVLRDHRLERVGELGAVRRLSARERVAREIVRVRQVVDDRQQLRRELLAVGLDAADRDAAEADAVIAARAADEAHALRLPLRLPVGERDLERRVDRLRARVAEEHVIDVARQHLDEPLRRARTRADGPSGTAARSPVAPACSRIAATICVAAVAGVDAPESRRAVEDLAAVGGACSTCPLRRRSMRGARLNARFAVNGIHSSSSDCEDLW